MRLHLPVRVRGVAGGGGGGVMGYAEFLADKAQLADSGGFEPIDLPIHHAMHHGRTYHGGYFHDLADAERAAIALRNSLFTHNDTDRRSA